MTGAYAHQVGESYLFLKVFENHLEGRVHTTVSDLDDSLSIDANGDGKVTEDELKAKLTEAPQEQGWVQGWHFIMHAVN